MRATHRVMPHRRPRWAPALGFLLALLAGASAGAAEAAGKADAPRPRTICILFSRDMEPYRDAVAGFKESLAPAGPCKFIEQVMSETDVGGIVDQLKKADPDLLLTLGTEASKVAAMHFEGKPILFTMVANPTDAGILPRRPSPEEMVAGVTTDVAPKQQFELLQQAAPNVKRIAVVYCPQYTEATVTAGEKAAKELGLELVRLPVEPYRVDPAIDRLEKIQVDAIWTVTDPGVMVPASAKRILMHALKVKIPVVGFSPAMVRAGALLGLGIDPKALGRQAGEIAVAILAGAKKPADFHLVYPTKTDVVLNVAVAERIGITLPKAMVASAQVVHGQ